MGQRSQIYVRYNNGEKKGLVANYYGWNFGERMISRAKGGIDYIKEHVKLAASLESSAYEFGRDAEKLSRIFDVNFDMGDVAISCDIIQEYQELYPEAGFAEGVFLGQDNNDGKLFVDIDGDVIKYAFLDCDANAEHIMDAEGYMNWNNKHDWRVPTEYLSAEDIETCKKNIQFISESAQLMTKEEVLEFIHYDYAKDLGIVKDENFLVIDKLVDVPECGLAGIGATIVEAVNEEDNFVRDIGKNLHQILSESQGKAEIRKGIEQTILAITGYELSTLVGDLKKAYSEELRDLEEKEKPGLDEMVKGAAERVESVKTSNIGEKELSR